MATSQIPLGLMTSYQLFNFYTTQTSEDKQKHNTRPTFLQEQYFLLIHSFVWFHIYFIVTWKIQLTKSQHIFNASSLHVRLLIHYILYILFIKLLCYLKLHLRNYSKTNDKFFKVEVWTCFAKQLFIKAVSFLATSSFRDSISSFLVFSFN